jgi:hypothetical protein
MIGDAELIELRADIEDRIRSALAFAGRVSVDHRLTNTLLADSLACLYSSGTLLRRSTSGPADLQTTRWNAFLLGQRHMREAELRVVRQRQIVDKLRRNGEDARVAEELLEAFEIVLAEQADNLHILASVAASEGSEPGQDEG